MVPSHFKTIDTSDGVDTLNVLKNAAPKTRAQRKPTLVFRDKQDMP